MFVASVSDSVKEKLLEITGFSEGCTKCEELHVCKRGAKGSTYLAGHQYTIRECSKDPVEAQTKALCKFKRETMAAGYGAMLYYICQARNGKIFEGQSVNIDFVVQQIITVVRASVHMCRGYN